MLRIVTDTGTIYMVEEGKKFKQIRITFEPRSVHKINNTTIIFKLIGKGLTSQETKFISQ